MAIRHVVTIEVAPGKAADFASAFNALQAIAEQEEGCEQVRAVPKHRSSRQGGSARALGQPGVAR